MEKCTKFEDLFVNSSEEELLKHIEVCDDCRQMYEKMNRVSDLIKEVKPHYQKRKDRIRTFQKIAAVFVFVVFASVSAVLYSNEDFTDVLMYGDTLTAEDYGFPTDSYGLLMVD